MNRKPVMILGLVALLAFVVLLIVVPGGKPKTQPIPPTVANLGPIRTQPQVSIQGQTAFLIAPDGSLWWWGDSLPGFGANQLTPKRIDESHDWVRVSAGSRFGVALKADRSLWTIGELPAFTTGMSRGTGRILEVMPGAKWRQAVAGSMHVLALREDGTLWAWGNNSMGELGIGTTTNAYPAALAGTATNWPAAATFFVAALPVKTTQVGADTNWTAVAAGQMTSLGIKSDGSLWHWGAISFVMNAPNAYSPVPQTTPIQLGTNTDWKGFNQCDGGIVVTKQDGSFWLYPPWWMPGALAKSVQPLGKGGDWTMQSGGWPTGWGIKRDGTLWFWSGGGMGVGPGSPRQFDRRNDWQGVWTDGFGQTRVGLTADGQLWSWGIFLGTPLQPVTGPRVLLHRLVAIVRGAQFSQVMTYPSTQEPWVLMRFKTNAAVATPGSN